MIFIDFQIREDELPLREEENYAEAHAGYIPVTYFMMPVRWHINGIELFGCPPDCWSTMAIVDLAYDGLIEVMDLKEKKETTYSPMQVGITINFYLVGENQVRVVDGDDVDIIVDYDELLQALLDYRERVRALLIERAPSILENPVWGPWVKGAERIEF